MLNISSTNLKSPTKPPSRLDSLIIQPLVEQPACHHLAAPTARPHLPSPPAQGGREDTKRDTPASQPNSRRCVPQAGFSSPRYRTFFRPCCTTLDVTTGHNEQPHAPRSPPNFHYATSTGDQLHSRRRNRTFSNGTSRKKHSREARQLRHATRILLCSDLSCRG